VTGGEHRYTTAHDVPSFELATLQTAHLRRNGGEYTLRSRTASFFMAGVFAAFGLLCLLSFGSEKTAAALLAVSAWIVWMAVCRPPTHLSAGEVTFERDGLHHDGRLLACWEDVRTVNVISTIGLPTRDTFGRERLPYQTNVNVGVRKRGGIEFGLPELHVDDESRPDNQEVHVLAGLFRAYAPRAKVYEFAA
jgi:hypothetical protein